MRHLKKQKNFFRKIPAYISLRKIIYDKFFPNKQPFKIADFIKIKEGIADTVVHVGAHEGQELEDYLELSPKKILFIEADPVTFGSLQQKLDFFSSKTDCFLMAINALVSEKDGETVDFFRYNNKGLSSSIFKSTEGARQRFVGLSETGEALELGTRTLKSIFSEIEFKISGVAILILDIQGAELFALRGLGEHLLKFNYVEVEVSREPIYDGAPLFDDVNRFMNQAGFKKATGVPWHGDVIYERIN
jgi:FkbM family methyltransferase